MIAAYGFINQKYEFILPINILHNCQIVKLERAWRNFDQWAREQVTRHLSSSDVFATENITPRNKLKITSCLTELELKTIFDIDFSWV